MILDLSRRVKSAPRNLEGAEPVQAQRLAQLLQALVAALVVPQRRLPVGDLLGVLVVAVNEQV